MKVINAPTRSQSLLPESVRNIIESVNCGTRIVLKACQGTERTVEGLDEVTTLLLSQQRQRLMAEIEPRLITE